MGSCFLAKHNGLRSRCRGGDLRLNPTIETDRRVGWVRWPAALLMLLTLFGCQPEPTDTTPTVSGGVIDLTTWQWERDGVLPLSGEWNFQWYGDTGTAASREETTMEVPGFWGSTRAGYGQLIPSTGYGVYRLSVRFEPTNEWLMLRVPNISTAFELYVDGDLVISRGHPGMTAETSIPAQYPGTVILNGETGTVDIRLVVSNYHHRLGGVRSDFILGTAEQVERMLSRNAAVEYFAFGFLIMIGLYHLSLLALRRKELANLYFALLCLFVALRMGLVNEVILVRWLPFLNWELAIRVEYWAFVFSGWTGLAYYGRMYPHEFRKRWTYAFGAAAVALGLIAAMAPTIRFTSWLIAYQIYLLTICIFILAGLATSAYRKRDGAALALVGVAGMAVAMINDMLFYNGWWRSIDLVPFGLLFLVAMNAYLLARRSVRTFERAEQLSAELKQWNERLEERISARTEELRQSYETLAEAKIGLERMEVSRRQLVSNISHDLRTPITLLQGYLEAIRDGVIRDPEKLDATVKLMLNKVDGLNGLIQHLFDLSLLEARRVELSLESVTLSQWQARLVAQYRHDAVAQGLQFNCSLASEKDGTRNVRIDVRQMDRVFSNLLYNAIRHTPQGGTIHIQLHGNNAEDWMEVSVEDSGSGIPAEDLPFIFDRFYKKDKSRHSSSSGTGLGLAIAREIVTMHGGQIEAGNRPEGGSVFRIRLPLQ